MQTEFGLKDTVVITINAAVEGVDKLTFNELKLKSSFTGVYFKHFPLELKVKVKTGYQFKGWNGLESSDHKTKISPEGDMVIEPIIEKMALSSSNNKIIFNEICYWQDSTSKEQDWIELHNKSKESISMNGWELKQGFGQKDCDLLDFTLNPGEFVVLAEDKEALLAERNIDARRVIEVKKLKLKKKKFKLILLDQDKAVVDSITVRKPEGTGIMSLKNPEQVGSISNWDMNSSGSPNKTNKQEQERQEEEELNNQIIYSAGVGLFLFGILLLIIYRLRKKKKSSETTVQTA